jgi:hypothetical protein
MTNCQALRLDQYKPKVKISSWVILQNTKKNNNLQKLRAATKKKVGMKLFSISCFFHKPPKVLPGKHVSMKLLQLDLLPIFFSRIDG